MDLKMFISFHSAAFESAQDILVNVLELFFYCGESANQRWHDIILLQP